MIEKSPQIACFFCQVLLQRINIRWLSLLPSIERLIETYEPFKLYFLNDQTKTKNLTAAADNTQLLTSFFNNPDGLCTLNFLENLLGDIQQTELNLQRTHQQLLIYIVSLPI
ncbi:unnamed protein product [Rotaria magnacalcarata]|uniref:Uncharacterized protein n=1 Tax=Rotaria magnacalcarata TaxID=392030 RepID=A0A816LWU4_9BILA|nr:unnamed protein product [Rotaria magnacalcarata]CAF5180018.1 unnamed protein product [Rotaria magnacalcarata]